MSLVVGSAGADCYRIVTCSGWGIPELAESVGELAAKLLVLGGQFAIAAQREVEALADRVVAGALPGRGRGGVLGLVAGAQAPDFVFEVSLGVEPGSGDSGAVGDGFEGDLGPGAVEIVQGSEGLGASVLVTPLRGGGEMNAVVRAHVQPSQGFRVCQ